MSSPDGSLESSRQETGGAKESGVPRLALQKAAAAVWWRFAERSEGKIYSQLVSQVVLAYNVITTPLLVPLPFATSSLKNTAEEMLPWGTSERERVMMVVPSKEFAHSRSFLSHR